MCHDVHKKAKVFGLSLMGKVSTSPYKVQGPQHHCEKVLVLTQKVLESYKKIANDDHS